MLAARGVARPENAQRQQEWRRAQLDHDEASSSTADATSRVIVSAAPQPICGARERA